MRTDSDLVNKVKELESRLKTLERKQVRFNRLEEVTNDLGLQQAGEFRSGNGVEPGNGFTGGRFGYPGFEYDGKVWFLAGVNNDAMMVGLDLETGNLVAGGSTVKINNNGVSIEEGAVGGIPGQYPEHALSFVDTLGTAVAQITGFLNSGTGSRTLSLDAKCHELALGYINFSLYDASNNEVAYLKLEGNSGDTITDFMRIQKKAKILGTGAICGGEQTIADDGVYSFTPESPIGLLLFYKVAAGVHGLVIYDTGAPSVNAMLEGTNVDTRTGALTGTTGTDGKFTVSCSNINGKIYLENRRGSSSLVRWNILAGSL